MSNLTIKQENFCLAYIETGNASEAYRRAYNVSNMTEKTVGRSAKELLDNPKITAKLEELRKPVIEAAQLTLKEHLDELARLKELAITKENYNAAITAETNRGKASGLYVDKIHATGDITVNVVRYSNDDGDDS